MSSSKSTDDLPSEEEMVSEEEILQGVLPFDEYSKDTKKLRTQIEQLERMYKAREKVIDRIIAYGTGIESENALRMYPTSTLKKWEDSLEEYRAAMLKKK